jgi:hypothetical protein
MAVLRGAGVFETRSETIMRHRFQDAPRAEGVLEELKRKCRREAERKFGRNLGTSHLLKNVNARVKGLIG